MYGPRRSRARGCDAAGTRAPPVLLGRKWKMTGEARLSATAETGGACGGCIGLLLGRKAGWAKRRVGRKGSSGCNSGLQVDGPRGEARLREGHCYC
jgi:hypothetical protein